MDISQHVHSWHRGAAQWLLDQADMAGPLQALAQTARPALVRAIQEEFSQALTLTTATVLFLAMDLEIHHDESDDFDPMYAMKLTGELSSALYPLQPQLATYLKDIREGRWPNSLR